jgi:hypothetical protein
MDSLLSASPLGDDGPLHLWKARSDVTLIVEFAVENPEAEPWKGTTSVVPPSSTNAPGFTVC